MNPRALRIRYRPRACLRGTELGRIIAAAWSGQENISVVHKYIFGDYGKGGIFRFVPRECIAVPLNILYIATQCASAPISRCSIIEWDIRRPERRSCATMWSRRVGQYEEENIDDKTECQKELLKGFLKPFVYSNWGPPPGRVAAVSRG